jgi:malate dehydrogenase
LDGEFGIEGLSIGVPCIIGKNGIERIVEVSLSESEKNKLKESAAGVAKTNALLD